MVTVIDFAVRQNSEGEEFIALILQGGLEMVMSKETGKYYATSKKCSISSTFTEEAASQLIGQTIPGRIVRKECESYQYTLPETGETVELSHFWTYDPQELSSTTVSLVQPHLDPVQPDVVQFSSNGKQVLQEA